MKFLHRHSAIFFLAWVVASALASGLPAASQTLEASVRTAEALPVDPSVFLQSPQQPAASIGGAEADAVIEGVITDARGALVPGAAGDQV